MQTLNELFSIDDALRLDLVNVGLEHGLKGCAESLVRELKLCKNRLHLIDCHTTSVLSVRFLKCVVQLKFLQVHFGDIN